MSIFDDLYQVVLQGKRVDILDTPPESFLNILILGQTLKQSREGFSPSDAFDVLLKLEPLLNDKSFVAREPLLARGYQKIVDYLRFVALPFQTDGVIEKMFCDRLLFTLNEGVDIQSRVDTYLATIGDDVHDKVTRQAMLRGLRANQEILGRGLQNINVGTSAQLPPTLKNWLQDYELMQGGKSDRGAFEQSEYMAKGANVKGLEAEEQKLLRTVLKLYDYLLYRPAVLPSVKLLAKQKNLPSIEHQPTAAVAEDKVAAKPVITPPAPAVLNKASADLNTKNNQPVSLLATLPPTPLALKSAKPAFLFDEQDEREADKFRTPNTEQGTLEQRLRNLADKVIAKHKLSFADEARRRRFVNTLVSFVKGVRGMVETREALGKSYTEGGLEVTADKIDSVLQIIQQAKKDFESGVVALTPKGVSELDALIKADVVSVASKLLNNQEVIIKNKPVQFTNKPSVAPVPAPSVVAKTPDYVLKDITNRANPASPAPAPKPELTDVRAPRRTLGPLDELRSLTLIDFRRLGHNSQEALAHVRQKIDFAGEHSVGKRVEAIRAWQGSAIHQMYMRLGRDSIESGQPIAQIIASIVARGEPTLTEAEFNAIVDFNESLRF